MTMALIGGSGLIHENCVRSDNKSALNLLPGVTTTRGKRKNLKTGCEGWDSNPRTPARLGPQPSAFDRAWLPSPSFFEESHAIQQPNLCPGPSTWCPDVVWRTSLLCHNKEVVHLKECYVFQMPPVHPELPGEID
jgi:hypothetical protein